MASQPCVLLVEDEDAIADTLAYALRTEGFVTQHVRLLAEARAALSRQSPALIVLDVGLPDGSGFDLCREVRQRSDLPIVMLTARSEEVDRVVGLELGADDYVLKPFSPREVALRVRSILRRTEKSRPDDTAAHGLTVDEAGQRICWQGAALPLTRLEFLLLRVLLTQPQRIFSRATLLDRVWGQSSESADRTVDTHIKTLRAKLREAHPDAPCIVTHRGLGYSLT